MRRRTVPALLAALLMGVPIAALTLGCTKIGETEEAGSATEATAKIPITSSSQEARDLYIEGRDMAEKLRAVDARPHLQQAVEMDPTFAAGYLLLANTAPSNEEFFSNLEQAVANMENASEGEKLQIRALQAGVEGRADEQVALLRELVQKYPGDERAHNALANQLFGRQQYDEAITEYEKAVEINPEFSPAYNSMGYAARAAGHYEKAEQAFRSYVEVLPNEPNPYDSYAEFLMKMGRFDESIAQYRKALEVDPTFTISHAGIASNQMFQGKGGEARKTLEEMYAEAPNDAIRRQALLWKAASYLHEGNRASAMEVLKERRAIAEKTGDWLAVSNDDALIGRTYLETGDAAKAASSFASSVQTVEKAQVPEEVKEGIRRNNLYNEGLVALAQRDLEGARAKSAEYHERVVRGNIPFEVQADHELMGRIALAEGNPTEALTHLESANQQDPRVLVLTAEANRAAGNSEAAGQLAQQAADFNQLSFPLSYVRGQARGMAGA